VVKKNKKRGGFCVSDPPLREEKTIYRERFFGRRKVKGRWASGARFASARGRSV
jgi:hypothetical protein